MGCVETKEFKDLEVNITDIYKRTRQRFFLNKKIVYQQEIKLKLDLKLPSSNTIYTKSNRIPSFGKDQLTTRSKTYLQCPKEDYSVDDSYLSSTCYNSFRAKIVS